MEKGQGEGGASPSIAVTFNESGTLADRILTGAPTNHFFDKCSQQKSHPVGASDSPIAFYPGLITLDSRISPHSRLSRRLRRRSKNNSLGTIPASSASRHSESKYLSV